MDLPNNCKGCLDTCDDLRFGYCADCYWNLAECTREQQAAVGMSEVFAAVTSGNVAFFTELAAADEKRRENGVVIRPMEESR
jgi:hypothetical protein